MTTLQKSVSLLLLAVLLCGAVIAADSQPVKLEQLPAAAQRAVLLQSQNKGKLGEIDKSVEDGEVSYDVELIQGKRTRSFGVSPEGKLLYWEVFINEIPVPARQAIHAQVQAADGKLEEINRVVEDDTTSFEVKMTKGEREIHFTISAGGKLLTMEVRLEETPAAVQKTIRAQALNAVITRLEKNFEDDDLAYDVEGTRAGQKISFSVDAAGKLIPE